MDRLMERQLDHDAAALVKAAMEARGVRAARRIAATSARSRKVMTPGRSMPGFGSRIGTEPTPGSASTRRCCTSWTA
jgi:hypothetical protein